jgi:hypothetical protein
MFDGYFALIRCIYQGLTVEEAVELECGDDASQKKRGRKAKVDVPTRDVIKLKDSGVTWAKLAEMYGVNPKSLERHVARYRQAVGI